MLGNSVYSLGMNNQPRELHIGAYPDFQTKGDILKYLRSTGLSGWPHNSTNIHHLHVTLLHNSHLILPMDFPKEQPIGHPIDVSGFKHHVRPLSLGTPTDGAPIAILFPGMNRFRSLSDLLHKKFKLQIELPHYIFHCTISNIQMFHLKSKQYAKTPFKRIADYFHLPPYEGRAVFDTLKVNYDYR
jgi:hypothetical protein